MNSIIEYNEDIIATLDDLYSTVTLNADFIATKYACHFLRHAGSSLSEQDIAFLYNTDISPNGYFKANEIVMALGTCKALRYMIDTVTNNEIPTINNIVKLLNPMSYFSADTIKLLINCPSSQIDIKHENETFKDWCAWIRECYIRAGIRKLPIRFFRDNDDRRLAILETQAFWLYMSEEQKAERALMELTKACPKIDVFLKSLDS